MSEMQKEDVYERVMKRQDVLEHVAVDQHVNDKIQETVEKILDPENLDPSAGDAEVVSSEDGEYEVDVYATEEKAYTTTDGNLLICLEIHGKEFRVLVSPDRWEWREDSVANANGGKLSATQISLFKQPPWSNSTH